MPIKKKDCITQYLKIRLFVDCFASNKKKNLHIQWMSVPEIQNFWMTDETPKLKRFKLMRMLLLLLLLLWFSTWRSIHLNKLLFFSLFYFVWFSKNTSNTWMRTIFFVNFFFTWFLLLYFVSYNSIFLNTISFVWFSFCVDVWIFFWISVLHFRKYQLQLIVFGFCLF